MAEKRISSLRELLGIMSCRVLSLIDGKLFNLYKITFNYNNYVILIIAGGKIPMQEI